MSEPGELDFVVALLERRPSLRVCPVWPDGAPDRERATRDPVTIALWYEQGVEMCLLGIGGSDERTE